MGSDFSLGIGHVKKKKGPEGISGDGCSIRKGTEGG